MDLRVEAPLTARQSCASVGPAAVGEVVVRLSVAHNFSVFC
jgi:hypothetical protein